MNDRVQAIVMPKWGLTMEEGVVVAWLAEEGSSIESGQDLLEIETSKIINVYESPETGILRRQVAVEGKAVPVGALLGLLAEPSVPDVELDAFVERFNADFTAKATESEATASGPQIIVVGGLSLNYLRMGVEGGTPLILIHGFGSDLNNWLFNQLALAEYNDVLALDLPGHGRSSKEVGAADMAMLTKVLGDFLDTVGVERAYLVGHSIGGALALVFAMQNPGLVTGLTLLAPAGLRPEINMDFINGFIGASKHKEMRTVLKLLVADPELISRDMVNDVLKYKRLDGVDQALQRLAKGLFPGGQPETLDIGGLAQISAPISVIWGQNDRILPIGHSDGLPDQVEVHRLEGVGHMPHMEASTKVNHLIKAALS